jgi:hypothetical protein
MTTFRCTTCDRRVESPVLIGAGDCPHCGGDVVFDIHGHGPPGGSEEPGDGSKPAQSRRGLLGRLRRG